jgi:hypothetical protein
MRRWSKPDASGSGGDQAEVSTELVRRGSGVSMTAVVELQTGPYAARTRARYALFLELAGDPQLGEPLRRQRREFERWTEGIVIAVGITDPVPATRALMAFGDGLILHRLTIDPALDMRPAIEREVRALAES